MHAFFLVRGIYHKVEFLKTFLQSQMFDWQTINRITGQTREQRVQGSLRPWYLMEYIFPETALPEVMAMLNISDGDQDYGKVKQSAHMALLRKAIGAEKFPKLTISKADWDKYRHDHFLPMEGIAVHPIGIKKDEHRIVDEKDYQEAL